MKLYKFSTFTTSYYFPKTTRETEFLYGLYSPFGGKLSKAYWYMFKKFQLVRNVSAVDTEQVDFPYELIKEIESSNSVMSFNMGSPGVEQKISILGWDYDIKQPFFAKFSQKPKAIDLTKNEIIIYKLLSNTGLVPKLIKDRIGPEYAFIKTEYVKGKRPQTIELTREIMLLSLTLKDFHLTDKHINEFGLKCALSHGDFCPWNMLEDDGKIRLIDWELAADRPLGHDLFTYIVQTSLLLHPERNLRDSIQMNENIIKEYFNLQDITDYYPYLNSFVKDRCKYEISKSNKDRANRLNEIIQ